MGSTISIRPSSVEGLRRYRVALRIEGFPAFTTEDRMTLTSAQQMVDSLRELYVRDGCVLRESDYRMGVLPVFVAERHGKYVAACAIVLA